MIPSSVLVSSVSSVSNFHNLALFICHLFIDGQFRDGNILYDPKVFDDHLLTQIESLCPDQIPWHKTDITQPSLIPRNIGDRNDKTLQLIFFDPEHLAEEIGKFKDYFTFYRIFVFYSIDAIDTKKQNSRIKMLTPKFGSSTLVLHYDVENGSMDIDWVSNGNDEKRMSVDPKGISNHYSEIEGVNSFDDTFGEYERMQLIAIRMFVNLRKVEHRFGLTSYKPVPYFTNYFLSKFNTSYISMTCIFRDSAPPLYNQVINHRPRKHYEDLFLKYEFAEEKEAVKLRERHSYDLHFDSYLLPNSLTRDRGTMIHPLYPYQTIKLTVLFVYGKDFTRRMNILLIPESIQTLACVIVFFMSYTALVLCLVRKLLNLRRADLLSAFIDIMIVFIGGGNIRMQHKFEKWFFSILVIGAFFIVAIFSGDILDYVIRILNQKVNTFEQLAKINAPIYIDRAMGQHSERIHAMLRGQLGQNANYKGFRQINDRKSFAWIMEESLTDHVEGSLIAKGVDYDILQQSLGSINSQFYLTSAHYVPERIFKKINEATSLMIESGLAHFYQSLAKFQQQLKYHMSQEDDDDLQALTIEQLKRPMILIFCLWGAATTLLIAEFIAFKCIQWRYR